MPRPTVLVATTNPAMAYALKKRLKEPCRELGLRLEICPDGDKEEDKTEDNNLGICVYDSAEALFDALEKRDPMELADTLVVLDIGAELENAFRPAATKDKWHATKNCAGIAVELLLRFPQVFPVFLSPAVPWDEIKREGVQWPKPEANCATGNWGQFGSLRELMGTTRHKSNELSELESIGCLDQLFALQVPLHFVSPLDQGQGLKSTLERFARGMRCWFDPTGLRTLVRNYFLGTLFGNNADWLNTCQSREVLLNRLDHVVVAIDEEREFAMLNAYTAYKFGRRAWMVTTFAEFNNYPLWVSPGGEKSFNVVVLRDIDMRFSDIPDDVKWPDNCLLKSDMLRDQLKNIESHLWEFCVKDRVVHQRLGITWRVSVVSSNPNIDKEFDSSWKNEKDKRLGEKERRHYFGLPKPISTLYDLKGLLKNRWATHCCGCNDDVTSVISRIEIEVDRVDEEATGNHGAPYLNLAMAESLLQQAQRCEKGPVENLLGALMAGEAQELLLGMSRTTALEALLLQHKHEVMAEVEFPGVSHAINIKHRQEDVEAVLRQYTRDNRSLPMKNMFLSQFWSELKVAYHNGEQFAAAEAANALSLVHSEWIPREALNKCNAALHVPINFVLLLGWWVWLADDFFLKAKSIVIKVATSFMGWAIASALLILIASLIYLWCFPLSVCPDDPEKMSNIWIFFDVLLSSITLQPMGHVESISTCKNIGTFAVIMHLGFAYVLFGLFISMLYRKITRS